MDRRGLQAGIFYVPRCALTGVFMCELPPAKKNPPARAPLPPALLSHSERAGELVCNVRALYSMPPKRPLPL